MTFVDRRAEGHGHDQGFGREAVVGQADGHAKRSRQRRDRRKIFAPRRNGIARDAVQYCNRLGTGVTSARDGGHNLVERAHARRQDDRAAGGGDPANQADMRDVAAGDLVGVHADALEQVHGGLVERRGHHCQAKRAGFGGDGQVRRLVELELPEEVAERRRLHVRRRRAVRRDQPLRAQRLQLDCRCRSGRGRPYQATASSREPPWFSPISAIVNSGAPGPTGRAPILMSMRHRC